MGQNELAPAPNPVDHDRYQVEIVRVFPNGESKYEASRPVYLDEFADV
jgi:hypothetical protein